MFIRSTHRDAQRMDRLLLAVVFALAFAAAYLAVVAVVGGG